MRILSTRCPSIRVKPNMILSAAITLNDGNVSKYFMIDGAVAMEAFDTGSHMDAGMINLNWSDYVAIAPGDVGRLFASEWYENGCASANYC